MLRKPHNRSVRAGRNVAGQQKWVGLGALAIVLLAAIGTNAMTGQNELKGYDIRPTGLTPIYPRGFKIGRAHV